MKKQQIIALSLLASTVLAGCGAHQPVAQSSGMGDGGVVVTQTQQEDGVAIFNGRDAQHQRQTSPSVQMSFVGDHDDLQEKQADYLEAHGQETGASSRDLLVEARLRTEERKKDAGVLEQAILNWEKQKKREEKMRESEKLMASMRDYGRTVSDEVLKAQEEEISRLQRQLRSAEREVKAERIRQSKLLGHMFKTQDKHSSELLHYERKQTELLMEQRQLAEQLAALDATKAQLEKEKMLAEARSKVEVSHLKNSLSQAQKHADDNRHDLVLEAAQKLAEAERLSFEARMSKQEEMVLEAERMRAEADIMAERADAMARQQNISITTPDEVANAAHQMTGGVLSKPLSEAKVVLQVRDMALPDVFREAFQDMAPQVGEWRVSWELSGAHAHVLQDTWTMAVEATFEEFLAQVAAEAKRLYDVKLTFKRFDQSRLFVITDNE